MVFVYIQGNFSECVAWEALGVLGPGFQHDAKQVDAEGQPIDTLSILTYTVKFLLEIAWKEDRDKSNDLPLEQMSPAQAALTEKVRGCEQKKVLQIMERGIAAKNSSTTSSSSEVVVAGAAGDKPSKKRPKGEVFDLSKDEDDKAEKKRIKKEAREARARYAQEKEDNVEGSFGTLMKLLTQRQLQEAPQDPKSAVWEVLRTEKAYVRGADDFEEVQEIFEEAFCTCGEHLLLLDRDTVDLIGMKLKQVPQKMFQKLFEPTTAAAHSSSSSLDMPSNYISPGQREW